MGQAVFKLIQFPCNYSGAKLAVQKPGGMKSRPACLITTQLYTKFSNNEGSEGPHCGMDLLKK